MGRPPTKLAGATVVGSLLPTTLVLVVYSAALTHSFVSVSKTSGDS